MIHSTAQKAFKRKWCKIQNWFATNSNCLKHAELLQCKHHPTQVTLQTLEEISRRQPFTVQMTTGYNDAKLFSHHSTQATSMKCIKGTMQNNKQLVQSRTDEIIKDESKQMMRWVEHYTLNKPLHLNGFIALLWDGMIKKKKEK